MLNEKRLDKKPRGLLAGLLVAVLASVSACAGADEGPAATIRIAVQQQNFSTIPLTLAQDLGFMRDEGLTLDTTVGQATSTMTAGLLGGSFDLQIGGAELLVARAQGAPLVAIAGMCNAPVWSVVAKPGITSLGDLRGKTIATSGPDSVSTVAFVATMKHLGVQPDSYHQITAGGTAERYTAVRNGQADATILSSPLEFQAGEQGLKNLGSLTDALPLFVAGFVATTEAYAAKNAAGLEKFSRAWVRTLRWMHDPANASDLVTRVARILKTPEPVIRQAYQYWLTGPRASALFPVDGKIDPAALAGSARAFVDNGSLKPGQADLTGFIVNDYLDQAAKN
ncbi:ABC transporter substrate-binding protein [Amycolatopsis sp. NPDC049253]|uniref:ABC transporter substrate-binding protein n=1 Tax=Amycolatopsis sp. NPDC049253 TaxID=3155274 RepID=UPI00344A8621